MLSFLQLYVTGHSLGACLATLFSFEAASQPDSLVPKPVSLFSFAGPYVGDESFRAAHQLLEQHGKLRHLRVTNHRDIVTTVPKVSFRLKILDRDSHVGSLFKHVGINLRLYADSNRFEVHFPAVRTGSFSSAAWEMRRGVFQINAMNFHLNPTKYWKVHSLIEYWRRVKDGKSELRHMYLNELYAQEGIVGHLVPQF